MGAIASVSAHDGQNFQSGSSAGSGGSYAFVPSFIDASGVATWFVLGDVLDARPKFTLSVKLPKAGSQVARITAKAVLPVMDATDSSLKVGDCIGTIEFVIPKKATEDDRYDILAILTNLLVGNAKALSYTSGPVTDIQKAVVDLESVY